MTFTVDACHGCVYNALMAGVMADNTVKLMAEAADTIVRMVRDIDDGDDVPHLDGFKLFKQAGSFRKFLRTHLPGLLAAYDRKVAWAGQEAQVIARSIGATEGTTVDDALHECRMYLHHGNTTKDAVVKAFYAGRREAGTGPRTFRRHDWHDVDKFYEGLLRDDPTLGGVTTVTELVRLLPEEMGIKRTAFYPWLKNPQYKTPPRLMSVVKKNKSSSRSAKARSSSPRKR